MKMVPPFKRGCYAVLIALLALIFYTVSETYAGDAERRSGLFNWATPASIVSSIFILVSVSAGLLALFFFARAVHSIFSPQHLVTVNGLPMRKEWADAIEAAQRKLTYSIAGKSYARVRYGDDLNVLVKEGVLCHDCAVGKGQFHVPSCDMERCPACGGQVISCTCKYDDEVGKVSV